MIGMEDGFKILAGSLVLLLLLAVAVAAGVGSETAPLELSVPETQLLLEKAGQVKGTPDGQLEVRGRQYEMPLDAVPSVSAAIPVTINGVRYAASEVKVISSLKAEAGTGEHSGTMDVDIDVPIGSALPAGHLTLEYKGSASVSGSLIASEGVFRLVKATGTFAGMKAEGIYTLTIVESGSAVGSPATVSITAAGGV